MKNRGEVLHRRLSLKVFLTASLLAVSLVTFVSVFFLTTSIYQRSHVQQARNTAKGLSTQVIDSLLQLMINGWSRGKLLHFFKPVLDANTDIPMRITILRAPVVVDLFGPVEGEQGDPGMREVLATGRPILEEQGYLIRRIVPIRARQECLSCHSNAKPNDIFGVLKLEQDLAPAIHAHLLKLLLLFLLLSPIPILLAVLIAYHTTSKVNRSVVLLRSNITRVNSVRDLTNLELGGDRTDFVELNQILAEVDTLVGKMKDTAVDRQLLEFEVRLLESFLITSEVVRDWKEHVAKLLLQFNEVMATYALFSIFKVGEEHYDLEIFWRSRPSEETRRQFDRVVRKRVGEQVEPEFFPEINTNHTIVDPTGPEIDLPISEIELQVKSIFLRQPKIGGIVGIGIQSGLSAEIGGSLMIEGVLTTLVNVIGSVRAIYNYSKEMEYYATRDPLTGLFNQRMFWDLAANELHRAKRHGYRFALLVLDFDNFKMVNDRFGHIFGDTFLQMFAGKINDFLREGDVLTRYGGDEFVAILPETNQEDAYVAALRVLDSLKDITFEAPDGSRIRNTVSIGLAVYPDHSEELNALFMIADNMLYKAKREGKNRIGVPTGDDILQAFQAKDEQSLFLLNVLENPDQVVPMFQPIMDIATGTVCMYELLMGIWHDDHILRASSFVEVAEKMGIISQLDFIVIEKAFRELREKRYQGQLFINLSPNSLTLDRYVETVRELAARYEVEPEQIVFEVTERETVRNRSLLQKFALELCNKGFRFAIDDFGSGFSSFHYLKLFSFDYIKIEGDFVRNISRDPQDRAFVKSIISLARDMNIRTVAEYVENEDVLAAVEGLGADYAQGYHVGRPCQEIGLPCKD
ncbi:MAG TPA: bifunctional diguanylate cyclase/phosphodiesterase [Desulfobulbus sp.]|nr:bifunctional diguanylate cyclase/phosphodiesterase [Desulfobulbus sp.]